MNETDVKRLRQAIFQLINARAAEEAAQAALKRATEEVNKLEFEIVPTIMHEMGVNSIGLDGIDLNLKSYYRASIPVAKKPEAFMWLRHNGFEDLIKRHIDVNFVRGQDKMASKLIKYLVAQGWPYDDKEQVNHATL